MCVVSVISSDLVVFFVPLGRLRMSGRQIRLKRAELRMLRISELRRLMDALGISGEGRTEMTFPVTR